MYPRDRRQYRADRCDRARGRFDKVPGAKLIEYDGSPHGLFETDKDRFCDDLVAFLGGDSEPDRRLSEQRSETRQEEPAY